jgi:chemotaxis-related protein WspB
VLFLLCQLGAQRYAIDAHQIAEILPLVTISEMARAPEEVAGILVYRGTPVPVIDLSQLLERRPAERRLSTRVVMIHYPTRDGGTRLLGLVVEKATETIRREETDFVESGVSTDGAPYLGPIAIDTRGLVQRVDVARLLSARGQTLFDQSEQPQWSLPTSKTC